MSCFLKLTVLVPVNVNILLIIQWKAMNSWTRLIKSVLFKFSDKWRECFPQLHYDNSKCRNLEGTGYLLQVTIVKGITTFIIIIANIKNLTHWSVLSTQLQLLPPALLRSFHCSSLRSVVLCFHKFCCIHWKWRNQVRLYSAEKWPGRDNKSLTLTWVGTETVHKIKMP